MPGFFSATTVMFSLQPGYPATKLCSQSSSGRTIMGPKIDCNQLGFQYPMLLMLLWVLYAVDDMSGIGNQSKLGLQVVSQYHLQLNRLHYWTFPSCERWPFTRAGLEPGTQMELLLVKGLKAWIVNEVRPKGMSRMPNHGIQATCNTWHMISPLYGITLDLSC